MEKERFIKLVNALLEEIEIRKKYDNYFKIMGYSRDDNAMSPAFKAIYELIIEDMKLVKDPIIGTDLDYFLYDLEGGKNYRDGMIKVGRKNVPLKTAEDLWEFINYESK